MRDRKELSVCEPYYSGVILRAMGVWCAVTGVTHPPYYWLQQDHLEYSHILRIIDWWRPKKVLEIGYGAGGSALCLRLLLPHATIVHVDIRDFVKSPDFKNESVRYGHKVAKWLLQQGNWYFIHGDSTDPTIVRRLSMWFGLFDVLIIDGNHHSYFVKTDYRLYSSIVRVGGLIVFHDSRRDTQQKGRIEVREALDELGLKGFDVDNRKIPSPGLFWTIHRL